MAVETKDVLLRSVPAGTVKALKRASVELEQPMGQVLAGLVGTFLGLYVAMQRAPEETSPEERAEIEEATAEIARGQFADWQRVKARLGLD